MEVETIKQSKKKGMKHKRREVTGNGDGLVRNFGIARNGLARGKMVSTNKGTSDNTGLSVKAINPGKIGRAHV